MPEGDTIYRAAVTLRPAMEGGTIVEARLRDRQFEVDRLLGAVVRQVEARGKHLLMHLSTGDVIHSHMGMTGSWHIYRPGQPWRKPEHYAALFLSINDLEVICFSPKQLELLTADQFRRHEHIHQLGPDVAASREFDVDEAIRRFRTRNSVPLGEAVMNQRLVCGIGNIYKSEVLFIMGFDPFAPLQRYSDDELRRMLQKARALMVRNNYGPRRTTRFGSDAGRMWVYNRSGTPCPKCGAEIRLRRQGEAGRTTCWCPECQPAR
jgi:endonuclease VIII